MSRLKTDFICIFPFICKVFSAPAIYILKLEKMNKEGRLKVEYSIFFCKEVLLNSVCLYLFGWSCVIGPLKYRKEWKHY